MCAAHCIGPDPFRTLDVTAWMQIHFTSLKEGRLISDFLATFEIVGAPPLLFSTVEIPPCFPALDRSTPSGLILIRCIYGLPCAQSPARVPEPVSHSDLRT